MAVCWKERTVDPALVDSLETLGLTRLQARILALRGVTPETADLFFNPRVSLLSSPCELPGVEEAAEMIMQAVRAKEKIVVFGDYDCDGVCATAILVHALRALDASVVPFLPERLSEGYGMNPASIDRLLKEHPGVSLVVTVDNGINSVEQVALLKDYGIRVIVTDHHLPGETLPDCTLVNPKVSAPKHLEGLCGAGVAFLLAGEIMTIAKRNGDYSGSKIGGALLILAGLATVTDIMPILGQNRILVAEALRNFYKYAPVGLKELLDRAARKTPAPLTARDFGFLIGPRINAAGRMASAMEAVNLILSTNQEEAREIARIVDMHNVERKTTEQKMTEDAIAQIEENAPAQVIVLSSGDAHQGIGGIVAARILERLCSASPNPVPVVVIVGDHGSARSPERYHVRNALQDSAEALKRFGGHAAAGGLTIRDGCVESFKKLFRDACAKQAAKFSPDSMNTIYADAEITAKMITLDFANWIQTLEPFGEANQMPTFILRDVKVDEVKSLGTTGSHLQIKFKNNIPRAIWWNNGEKVEELRANSSSSYDALVRLEVSSYGSPHVELRIQALQQK